MTTQERLAMQFGNEYIGQFILLAQVARRTCDHDVLSRITTASGKWYEVVYMVFLANVTATVKALTTLRGVLVLNIFKCVLPSSPFFYGTTGSTFYSVQRSTDRGFTTFGYKFFIFLSVLSGVIQSLRSVIAVALAAFFFRVYSMGSMILTMIFKSLFPVTLSITPTNSSSFFFVVLIILLIAFCITFAIDNMKLALAFSALRVKSITPVFIPAETERAFEFEFLTSGALFEGLRHVQHACRMSGDHDCLPQSCVMLWGVFQHTPRLFANTPNYTTNGAHII